MNKLSGKHDNASNIQLIIFKVLTAITALSAAVFVFFNWVTVGGEIIEVTARDSYSFSLVTLPSFIVNIVSTLEIYIGASYVIAILIALGLLEFAAVLSAGFSVYGIYKQCIRNKPTKIIMSSQIVAITLQLMAAMLVIIVGLYIDKTPLASLGSMLTFRPTLWLYISFLSSAASLACTLLYNKQLNQ